MTRNEVEEIKRHFDEVAGGLRQEMGGLRQELREEIAEVGAGLRQEMGGFRQEIAEVAGGLRQEMGGLRQELREEIAEVAGGLRQEMGGLRQEMGGLRQEMGGIRQELGQEIAEVRRHAGVVAEDLRSEIRAVGDGVALAYERLNQVDLRVDSLTGEVRRGFAGVRAEIHGLHETDDELRRRIENLEQRGA